MSNAEYTRPNPDRETFFEDLAQLLGRGYTLLASDINSIMPFYGWGPNIKSGSASPIMANHHAATALAAHGVSLVVERHKGVNVYRDDSLNIADTDIIETRSAIETAQNESRERAQRTKRIQQAKSSLAKQVILHK